VNASPQFDDRFRAELADLFRWRRDVRRFRRDPVDPDLVDELLRLAATAPSVGLSEPWRFLKVEDPDARAAALANFEAANAEALAGYSGAHAKLYASLKLSGLRDAPVQLAAFCDESGEGMGAKGKGLGARTMPEMRRYSVVCAVMQLWLAARALGLGLGWLSILDPEALKGSLGAPKDWRLVAYLCLGWPEEEHADAELERAGWEPRVGLSRRLAAR